ncbi:MAG: hypothetical protein KDB57_12370 [Solirubrobacterales bacterium]|nr:hypothetical protein [Solirubrobacterales bacterium]
MKLRSLANSATWGFLAAPILVVVGLAIVYLVMAPHSADHAAQTFRTELFELSGPTVWNNYWFGGHYLPTYSLLAPPLGAWLGFRVMGSIAVVGTVILFTLISRREWGERAQAGAIWFAFAATISLFSGRLTFALGVLLAMAAVFAAQRGQRIPALILAGSVGLASPVAALFLACVGFAHFLAERPDRRGLELAAVAFLVAGVVAIFFPGGGDEPYVTSSFVPAIVLTLVSAAMVPPGQRLFRVGMLVYAGALVASYVLSTPMGGNVNRLGALLLGPVLLCALAAEPLTPKIWKRGILILLLPLIVWWQTGPVIRDLKLVDNEPAVSQAFYQPLADALAPRLEREPARVEVVPVASHWEAARAAAEFPLARGWERQTDRHLNPLFYAERLTPERYRRWLDRLAVGYVALPDTELDYAGEKEAALIRGGLPFLEEIPVGGEWQLFRVKDAKPMVERPARLSGLETDGFTVSAPVAGSFLVRIRSTPYWRVDAGNGCVERGPGDWTQVVLDRPGSLRISADFSPGARFGAVRDCRPER